MSQPKTIREWLETLPDGYRERALANTPRPDREFDTFEEALDEAFIWHFSPEKYAFWRTVASFMRGHSSLPPLHPLPPPSETESLKQRIAELEAVIKDLIEEFQYEVSEGNISLKEARAALAGKEAV